MITCKFCNSEFSTMNHQVRCRLNPDRKMKIWTDDDRRQNGIRSRAQKDIWTAEKRALKSAKMKEVVKDNPDSYSKNNVSGRVKMYEVSDSFGKTTVKGTWELKVATWLNDNNIKWTNKITPISYYWNDSWHLYFPDFHMIDTDTLIEVKGYETDRDIAKWQSVNKQLFVIRKSDMSNLDNILKQAAGWLSDEVS